MDSLTHALAGTLIADALPYTRRLGPKAPLMAALVAMSPDLDMLPAIIAKFPPQSLEMYDLLDFTLLRRFHRTYTHSFLFTALASIPLAWLAWRWSGRKGGVARWAPLLALAFFSHIVLDIANRWGVAALLPFSGHYFAWSLLRLVDPFIMAVLATVFVFNHALRDSHAGPEALPPAPGSVRERTAAWANRLAGPSAVAWAGTALIVGRIVYAVL